MGGTETRNRGGPRSGGAWTAFAVVFVLAVGVRAVWAPLAGISTYDAWLRTWVARLWLEDPEWIDAGVWGPLHFYLLGGMLALVPDMLTAGRTLHVLAGALAAVAAAGFAGELARARFAALTGGLAFALAPLCVATSLEVRAEIPTLALLFVAAWAVARRRNGGGPGSVLLAGLAAAGATMLRYEAWLAVPAFALLLWSDRRALVPFLALALAFPLLWMWGNWRVFGDPLYFAHQASAWALEVEGRAGLPFATRVREAAHLLQAGVRGLSVPLAIACALALVDALARRERRAWTLLVLLPALLHFASVLRGSLDPKPQFAVSWTAPALPLFGAWLAERRAVLGSRRTILLAVGILAAAPLLALPGSLGTSSVVWRLGALPMVPRMEGREMLEEIARRMREEVGPGGGLLVDRFGYGARGYLLLALSPAPGEWGDASALSRRGSSPGMVLAHFDRPRGDFVPHLFLRRRPRGVLLVQEGSSFARRSGLSAAGGRLVLPEACLDLEPLRVFEVSPRPGRLLLFRYRTCADGA